jgi:glycerol-3-phosphate O-acyltransferase
MNWLLRRLVVLWVRFKVRPENAAALLAGRTHPVCYVLERRSGIDTAVLQEACKRLHVRGKRLPGGAPGAARTST